MGGDTYVSRKNTPITIEWFRRISKTLDEKYERLKLHPAVNPRERVGMMVVVNGVTMRSQYPLMWEEINAIPFARA